MDSDRFSRAVVECNGAPRFSGAVLLDPPTSEGRDTHSSRCEISLFSVGCTVFCLDVPSVAWAHHCLCHHLRKGLGTEPEPEPPGLLSLPLRESRTGTHYCPESNKRRSSERNSSPIEPYGRYDHAGKPSDSMSIMAPLWLVKAIFEKRAVTMKVDTLYLTSARPLFRPPQNWNQNCAFLFDLCCHTDNPFARRNHANQKLEWVMSCSMHNLRSLCCRLPLMQLGSPIICRPMSCFFLELKPKQIKGR